MNPLTTLELDVLVSGGCANPACEHKHHSTLFLHSRCHPDKSVWIRYDSRDRCVHVECSLCNAPVATIKVAEP